MKLEAIAHANYEDPAFITVFIFENSNYIKLDTFNYNIKNTFNNLIKRLNKDFKK